MLVALSFSSCALVLELALSFSSCALVLELAALYFLVDLFLGGFYVEDSGVAFFDAFVD
jgi:hypothetical protein